MAFFTSPNPHFFKIILHRTLIQRKLDLPKKFVKSNGGSLLYNKATLRLPDGAKWEVEIKKSGATISFVRGWPEFVKFYSVKAGYFVVFRFEGNLCFNVVIFDLSATEIDYPSKPHVFYRRRKGQNRGSDRQSPVLVPKSENEEDEDSVQILGNTVLRTKKRREKNEETAYCSLREMKKKMRKNVKTKHQPYTTPQRFDDEEEEEEEEDLETNVSRRQSNYRGSANDDEDEATFNLESMRPMHPPRKTQALTEEQEGVRRRAKSFKIKTKNPSFMVTMRPSYIQTGNYLSLPRDFAERYLKESVDVKLEVADGRIWSVWCGVRWAFTRRRTELKGGWKGFVVDNELQEGDICVFELLLNKSPQVFFRVAIFHLPPSSSSS